MVCCLEYLILTSYRALSTRTIIRVKNALYTFDNRGILTLRQRTHTHTQTTDFSAGKKLNYLDFTCDLQRRTQPIVWEVFTLTGVKGRVFPPETWKGAASFCHNIGADVGDQHFPGVTVTWRLQSRRTRPCSMRSSLLQTCVVISQTIGLVSQERLPGGGNLPVFFYYVQSHHLVSSVSHHTPPPLEGAGISNNFNISVYFYNN